jgi:hypothetical protein
VGEHIKSWDTKLFQAEFAYNRSTNRSTGLSPFTIIYGSNPRAPLDLAPIPDMMRTNTTAEDLMIQIQGGHKLTIQKLQESTTKYKASADKKRRAVEFEEGDFVWAILTKDRFPMGEYNKLAAHKVGPVEIITKINPNAYRLKLPRHTKTSDVFNVKHLVPFIEDSLEEDVNLRTNSLQPGEDDVDQIASEFMKTNKSDVSVKTPQRMVTRSQTRRTRELRPDGPSARPDPKLSKKLPECAVRRPFDPRLDERVIFSVPSGQPLTRSDA